jgi:hypothetical protein
MLQNIMLKGVNCAKISTVQGKIGQKTEPNGKRHHNPQWAQGRKSFEMDFYYSVLAYGQVVLCYVAPDIANPTLLLIQIVLGLVSLCRCTVTNYNAYFGP